MYFQILNSFPINGLRCLRPSLHPSPCPSLNPASFPIPEVGEEFYLWLVYWHFPITGSVDPPPSPQLEVKYVGDPLKYFLDPGSKIRDLKKSKNIQKNLNKSEKNQGNRCLETLR